VRGLLREWSELWPAAYSLLMLKEELWMHVVLRGLSPGFQHIRNGYAGAQTQDASTLERLLDSNDAMDSATGSQAAFAAQLAPSSAFNAAGRLQRARPASTFDCLWCETNGNHFTEECRNLQRSKEQRKANRAQSKVGTARASHSRPTPQMPHLQSSLVKQVASSLLQTSLITTGTRTQGPRAI
jgi:hypothetical protein